MVQDLKIPHENRLELPRSVDNAIAKVFPGGFHFDTHMHRVVELLLCLDGCMEIKIHGEAIPVNAGEYIAIFPDTPHQADVPGDRPCSILQTHFHSISLPDLIAKDAAASQSLFLLEVSLGRRKYIKDCFNPQLEACLEGLRSEFAASAGNMHEMLSLYLAQINILLSRDLWIHRGDASIYENRHLVRAIYFANQRYMEKITVEDVASYVGVSSRYLSKMFHEQLQIGVADYITCVRISKAIERKYSDHRCTLTELALDVGFGSLQHFSQVFKKKMGISPKRYFSIQQFDF